MTTTKEEEESNLPLIILLVYKSVGWVSHFGVSKGGCVVCVCLFVSSCLLFVVCNLDSKFLDFFGF